MGEVTKIQWCHHTFNLIWGCVEVSAECDHCYAREWAKRLGFDVWGKDADRRILSDDYWLQLAKWNKAARAAGERRRVFCSSMADVLEDHPIVATQRERLYPLIEECVWLDFLMLTKRPQNFMRFTPKHWRNGFPPNVWAMTTAGLQKSAWRIDELLKVPAAVRGLSVEPMLSSLDIPRRGDLLHWAIIGGESGAKARPFSLAHARRLIRQCQDAGTAVFVKQLGAWPYDDWPHDGLPPLPVKQNGQKSYPFLNLNDDKGGNISEWPADLRIREFPVCRA